MQESMNAELASWANSSGGTCARISSVTLLFVSAAAAATLTTSCVLALAWMMFITVTNSIR